LKDSEAEEGREGAEEVERDAELGDLVLSDMAVIFHGRNLEDDDLLGIY